MVFEQPIATKVFDKQILGRLQKRRWGRQGSRKESFVVPHYSLKVLAPELRRVHSVGITKPEIVMWGDGSDDSYFAVDRFFPRVRRPSCPIRRGRLIAANSRGRP